MSAHRPTKKTINKIAPRYVRVQFEYEFGHITWPTEVTTGQKQKRVWHIVHTLCPRLREHHQQITGVCVCDSGACACV